MRLSVYVIFLFSMTFIFYLLGFTSPAIQQMQQLGEEPKDFITLLKELTSGLLSKSSLELLLGISLATFILSILTGYGATYIFPLIMLLVVANYVILPTSFMFDATMPEVVKVPLIALFNILTIMTILEFARGSA